MMSDFWAILLFGILRVPIVTEGVGGAWEKVEMSFLARFERIFVGAVIVSDCIRFFIIVVLSLQRGRSEQRDFPDSWPKGARTVD